MGIISGFDHICIVTDDIDRSVDFYTRLLGFTFGHRETVDVAGVEVAAVSLGAVTVEFVRFTDGRENVTGDGVVEMLGFATDDIFAAIDVLRGEGVEFVGEPVRVGEDDWFAVFRGPSGEKLELTQRQLTVND
ncbi:MAG: VOC family protein [Oscillospiraceae bacterium]|jgi:catechol 2,3-dioxygenase-like lactoylglutathione lyase family enzyme|nr:VOC family protein [Oscillospiraceae bacterium]